MSYFNGNVFTPDELDVLSRVLDESWQGAIVLRSTPVHP
jgi:hypothetical protein